LGKINTLASKANYYLLLFIALLLPVFRTIIPVLLFLLFVSWLLEGNFTEKWDTIKKTKLVFILPAFYILHIIGLCYSQNLKYGFFDLEVKLSFLFIPFLFINNNEYVKKNYDKILLFFVAGNLLEAFICLGNSVINLFHKYYPYVIECFKLDPKSFFTDNFTYHFLSPSFHPSYFSMYCALCLQILIYFLFNNIYRKHRGLLLAAIFFFVVFIFLLSSKAGIIIVVILILGNILILFKRKKIFWLSSIVILLLAVLLFFTLKYNQRLTNLFSELETTSISNKSIKTDDERLLIWYNSKGLIKDYPLFGVGTGDIKDKLIEVYHKNNMQKAELNNYNAHNQFLETFITLGVTGFLLLMAILIIPLVHAIKRKNILLLAFTGIILINFIFESMLNTQAGVVFFAFFYSFLNFTQKKEIEKSLNFKNND
jgi:O-antigen ligase